jgi:hypothetical protein
VFPSSKFCVLISTNCKILKTLITVTKQRSLDLNVRMEVTYREVGSLSKAKQESGQG